MRVLKWIVERTQGRANAVQTPLGWTPNYEDLDWTGLEGITRVRFEQLTRVDTALWRRELRSHLELFDKLKEKLPRELSLKRELLELRLGR